MPDASQTKKRAFKPLHERLTSDNSETLKQINAKQEDIKDLYRMVFETENGQALLEHLTNKYIGHVPSATATPNEIMFLHGNAYIIHEILNNLRKEK